MVPTKESFGRSGSFGFGATAAGFTTGAKAIAGGGRRDDEKMGRSRVPDNAVSGMAHNGLLALCARPCIAARGVSTACAGAAGVSEMADSAGLASWDSSSAASTLSAGSMFSAGRPCDDKARTVMPIAKLSIALAPAIAGTTPAGSAVCPFRELGRVDEAGTAN